MLGLTGRLTNGRIRSGMMDGHINRRIDEWRQGRMDGLRDVRIEEGINREGMVTKSSK